MRSRAQSIPLLRRLSLFAVHTLPQLLGRPRAVCRTRNFYAPPGPSQRRHTRPRGLVGPRHDAAAAAAPARHGHRREAPALNPRVAGATHSAWPPWIPQSAARATLAADAALVGGAAAALAAARAAVDAAARAHAGQRPPPLRGGGAAVGAAAGARAARGADEDVRAERLAPRRRRRARAARRGGDGRRARAPRPLPEAAREAAVDPLRRVGRSARDAARPPRRAVARGGGPPRAAPRDGRRARGALARRPRPRVDRGRAHKAPR